MLAREDCSTETDFRNSVSGEMFPSFPIRVQGHWCIIEAMLLTSLHLNAAEN